MASFTLLGSQVIRMPFILTSSYPHEILHNWWGNSVFVDYESGNWCEGLTAYMADHLMAEQRGQGEAHRRDRLQDYSSYVRAGRDFPLTEFRSRHSAATEAVGYGKTLMGFHMLRRKLGDDRFRDWAARFYREMRGRVASFGDVRRTMEAVIGHGAEATDLGRFFRDWTERPGAAALAVEVGRGRSGRGRLRGARHAPPDAGGRTVRARRADRHPDRGRSGDRRSPSTSRAPRRRSRSASRRGRWRSRSIRRSTSSGGSIRARSRRRSARSSASRACWRSSPRAPRPKRPRPGARFSNPGAPTPTPSRS